MRPPRGESYGEALQPSAGLHLVSTLIRDNNEYEMGINKWGIQI